MNAVLIRDGDPRWHTSAACQYVAGASHRNKIAIDEERLEEWIVTTSILARTRHHKERKCSGGLCKHLPFYDYDEERYL